MAGRAPGVAPVLSPAPSIIAAAVQPAPSPVQDGLSLPVTKIVTLSLFVASLIGFIMIGLFVTFSFYRRRSWMRQRMIAAESARHEEEAAVMREIPFLEGFIVANPCGAEQVAYKLQDARQEVELREVVVKTDTDTDDEQQCSGSANPQVTHSHDTIENRIRS